MYFFEFHVSVVDYLRCFFFLHVIDGICLNLCFTSLLPVTFNKSPEFPFFTFSCQKRSSYVSYIITFSNSHLVVASNSYIWLLQVFDQNIETKSMPFFEFHVSVVDYLRCFYLMEYALICVLELCCRLLLLSHQNLSFSHFKCVKKDPHMVPTLSQLVIHISLVCIIIWSFLQIYSQAAC